jgi:hypothetical protein
MGMFSFKTADTEQSIMNMYSGNFTGVVYMLRPDDSPIVETEYEGYGVFGGVDCYEWVARINLPDAVLKHLNEDEIRIAGIGLSMGKYYIHKESGDKWSIFHGYENLVEGCKEFSGSFGTIMPAYGKTPNDMIESGEMVEVSISETMLNYPLKFSFNKDADYASLPASKDCPLQGYFDE